MPLIEKLGSFYLGKEYDLKAKQVIADRPVNYDSRDLTTHAVCVGMTGSGKTGLCIGLLEEAALDAVPAILIDPKGDITNLLLTFPELRPEDFLPWVNLDDARRKGQTPEEFAAKTAQSWREGLASWDQGPERIRALKAAADFTIYTPGSEAGLPVSILSSFQCPTLDWETEAETLRDQIQGTVSALLGLAGIQADPVRSREHILLSTVLENAWRAGQSLDIPSLIMAVQKPPFRQVGVFDVDTFFPEKDRFGLAMALNNIIASPSFGAWLKGEPLDIAALLHTPDGKPRHSIFYIAHLSDAERMFFVTILLQQIISWMRSQPGTTSLRALVYMDEVFGFFPPLGEPPSKPPMLTLLKQARAFGVGMLLATQNPVDLDYKGLTNMGTWFIGKLQAERDKGRLMDGLQSISATAGTLGDSKVLDKLISSLDNRVFLLHNVHAEGPVVMNTRWAMSYLRGPLTREQVKGLMAGRKAPALSAPAAQPAAAAVSIAADGVRAARPTGAATPEGLNVQPPALPPGIEQVYLPVTVSASQTTRAIADRVGGNISPSEQRLVYEPALLGLASVHFLDRARDVDETRDYSLLLPLAEQAALVSWKDSLPVNVNPRDLEDRPASGALFLCGLPEATRDARAITGLGRDLTDHLYRSEEFSLAYNPTLKLYAKPGESDRDFKVRCQQVAREDRDDAVEAMRKKYDAQLERLEERMAKEEQELAQDKADYQGRIGEEVLSGLSSVVGALGLFGRRSRSLTGLSSAASKRRMTSTAKADITESEAAIARMKADIEELTGQVEKEANALTQQWATAAEDIQALKVSPRKTDIDVQMVALAWAPSWEVTYEDLSGRNRTDAIPAYPLVQQA
jgi:hypothetical protein